MRITTKIIQNNSLNNINTNKLLQDKLSQQMSTEKKVNRPSDDPIVAIRALRLRTNVNQVTQYYEKNVPDAESWLEVTESALSSMSEVITDMIGQCTKGSNEDLTTSDREVILTALKALRDEVYSTGNADYAGRYIFTGYRTDTPLTFTDTTTQSYTITEQIDNSKIDKITYVSTGNILDINESNAGTTAASEGDVSAKDVYRIRLSYDNVDGFGVDAANGTLGIEIYDQTVTNPDGTTTVKFKDITKDANYEVASLYATPSPYANVGDDQIVLVKETGELLLGKNVYNKLMAKADDPTTTANEAEIRLNYTKSNWENNDLRPEHYFACESEGIKYNQDYLQGISDEDKQTIEYDVGLNQRIRVNTTADEVFTHDISRDVEDMIKAMEDSIAMEKQVEKLKKMVEAKQATEQQLAAAEKALTYLNEKTRQSGQGNPFDLLKFLHFLFRWIPNFYTRNYKPSSDSNPLRCWIRKVSLFLPLPLPLRPSVDSQLNQRRNSR